MPEPCVHRLGDEGIPECQHVAVVLLLILRVDTGAADLELSNTGNIQRHSSRMSEADDYGFDELHARLISENNCLV